MKGRPSPFHGLLQLGNLPGHGRLRLVEEIVGADVSAEEIERGRNLIIDVVDRSMNISILQYTLAAEEERNSAQGEARELHQQRDSFLVTLSHELRNQVSPILPRRATTQRPEAL